MKSRIRAQFLGLQCESLFNTDTEHRALQKFCVEYQQKELTFKDFVDALSEKPSESSATSQSRLLSQSTGKSLLLIDEPQKPQFPPHIIHMSTHGHHLWWQHDPKQAFQIQFEESHTLIQLVNDHREFSAYYAVIAILFETEISHFVDYWSHPKHRKIFGILEISHLEQMKTSIPRDSEKYPLLDNPKIYILLQTICNRFGCDCRKNDQLQNVEIFWGQMNRFGKWDDPRVLLSTYYFRELYSGDSVVQEILARVMNKYRETMYQIFQHHKSKHRQRLRKPPHIYFWWKIMCMILHRELSFNGAYPDESDDEEDESEDSMDEMDELDSEDEDYDSDSDSEEDDEETTTTVKLRQIQQLTYALSIEWDNNLGGEESERSKAKEDIVSALQKNNEVVLNGDFLGPQPHIHILRFDNVYSAQSAKVMLEKIMQPDVDDEIVNQHLPWDWNPDRFWDFQIILRPISHAPREIRRHVGHIKNTQRKHLNIDIQTGKDMISGAVEKKLSQREFKMRLAVINSCHSYILGRKMGEFVESVICTNPYIEILESLATKFTTEFYGTLRGMNDEKTPMSQLVLMAFQKTKHGIKRESKEKKKYRHKCRHHSHCHPSNKQRHTALHLGPLHNENWNELQKIMDSQKDDYAEFRAYQSRLRKSGVLSDRCTLKICNVSKSKMDQLKQYLSDQLTTEEMKENDISDRNDFVIRSAWLKDPNFEELSVGYFKFRSKAHRNLAKRKLNLRHRDESIVFSQRVHRGDPWAPKGKENDMAWYHRNVPRCCCSPEHPHRAEDKYMFIHNGHIVNRYLFDKKALEQQNVSIPDLEVQLTENESPHITTSFNTPMSPITQRTTDLDGVSNPPVSNPQWTQKSKSKRNIISANEARFGIIKKKSSRKRNKF